MLFSRLNHLLPWSGKEWSGLENNLHALPADIIIVNQSLNQKISLFMIVATVKTDPFGFSLKLGSPVMMHCNKNFSEAKNF